MSYKVRIKSFEGPFDLLVYLIENAQMSIYDIEISSITEQYLEYIRAMKEMDIAVGTEFMVLASSLIEIKSKMILPRISASGEIQKSGGGPQRAGRKSRKHFCQTSGGHFPIYRLAGRVSEP